VLDAARKVLALQNPPNDGRLNMVRPLVNLDISGDRIRPHRAQTGDMHCPANRFEQVFFYEIHLSTGDYNRWAGRYSTDVGLSHRAVDN
jgi:hypothetical protein